MAKKILYIEDNVDNILLVKRVLMARGYQFLWAPNGIAGVEMARTKFPDLILLDINLPDTDVYEVARQLRSNAMDNPLHVPIIAIRANEYKGDAEKALKSGCDVYMSKPISIRDLASRVKSFLPEPGPIETSFP